MTAEVAVSTWLSRNTGRSFASAPAAEIAGGSVHRCVRWASESGDAFVKLAAADSLAAFEAEAAGLQALAAAVEAVAEILTRGRGRRGDRA